MAPIIAGYFEKRFKSYREFMTRIHKYIVAISKAEAMSRKEEPAVDKLLQPDGDAVEVNTFHTNTWRDPDRSADQGLLKKIEIDGDTLRAQI